MRSPTIHIERGNALAYYAFDVAASIDMVKAEQLISLNRKKTQAAQEKRRQAKYFEFTPLPIRLIEEGPVCFVGPRFSTSSRVEVLVFDFGCVSVKFEIPIDGEFKDIIDLSIELYENVRLQEAAKSIVNSVLAKISAAVDRLEIVPRIEDYCIFHLSAVNPKLTPAELLQEHIIPITGLLRAESGQPSDREIQEILNDRISYGSNDVTLMSWYSAVIYGENAEDIYTVLEFTNLVLMELSYLDSRLDTSLDEFYDYFTSQHRRTLAFDFGSKKRQMRRISQLQIDSAISFERITNALKLMGDDFQARIMQLATKKMGLSLWDASVTRKMTTIESIYDKISDAESGRRMEVLEVIIIGLILLSILLPVFFPNLGYHH